MDKILIWLGKNCIVGGGIMVQIGCFGLFKPQGIEILWMTLVVIGITGLFIGISDT